MPFYECLLTSYSSKRVFYSDFFIFQTHCKFSTMASHLHWTTLTLHGQLIVIRSLRIRLILTKMKPEVNLLQTLRYGSHAQCGHVYILDLFLSSFIVVYLRSMVLPVYL